MPQLEPHHEQAWREDVARHKFMRRSAKLEKDLLEQDHEQQKAIEKAMPAALRQKRALEKEQKEEKEKEEKKEKKEKKGSLEKERKRYEKVVGWGSLKREDEAVAGAHKVLAANMAALTVRRFLSGRSRRAPVDVEEKNKKKKK